MKEASENSCRHSLSARWPFVVLMMLAIAACAPKSAAQTDAQAPQAQPVSAQTAPPSNCMPGMAMPGCPETPAAPGQETPTAGTTDLMTMQPLTFLQEIAGHVTSGTSAEPVSTPAPMLMTIRRGWMLMFHANVFAIGEVETGPRGKNDVFSTNWFMPMAQHEMGHGVFTVRAMLSLEPATIPGRQYPLLFQQGETAFGNPIADGQHPHNFFMELAALYDRKIATKALLSIYLAPVGDPALGPTAFPHRASTMEDPLATLGHHQEDSTHISDDVITAGFTYYMARIEASGFHGREPGEDRWAIDQGTINSWSTRLTLEPGKNWSGQVSYGRISSPEALFPMENQERVTASLMYNRPLKGGKWGEGNWASTFVWGRTRSIPDNDIADSYLVESTLRFRTRNYLWTRIEEAARTNLLIVGENPLPPGYVETTIGDVQAYTGGYSHDFDLVPHLASAVGAQFTGYGVPGILQPIYGQHPVGVAIFIRLRPFSAATR